MNRPRILSVNERSQTNPLNEPLTGLRVLYFVGKVTLNDTEVLLEKDLRKPRFILRYQHLSLRPPLKDRYWCVEMKLFKQLGCRST